jgi:hypothetical protein
MAEYVPRKGELASRKARRLGNAASEMLDEVLSILDACLYWARPPLAWLGTIPRAA